MPRLPPLFKTKEDIFHNLARGFVRMSWNKYNLYSLNNLPKHLSPQQTSRLSIFQQKWLAKRVTRAYHLPEIREKQFIQRHFKARLPLPDLTTRELKSVIGGIGNTTDPQQQQQQQVMKVAPVQMLAFAELERRLDVLLYRAHFATSTRQARHLVIIGRVFVNGEKCRVPSTVLNPGDIFTLHPLSHPLLHPPKDNTTKPSPRVQDLIFKPHRWMRPHMFIPPHLEVNYRILSGCLVHMPTISREVGCDVPTPYGVETVGKAFEWYSQRKRNKTVDRLKAHDPVHVAGRPVKLKSRIREWFKTKLKEEKLLKASDSLRRAQFATGPLAR